MPDVSTGRWTDAQGKTPNHGTAARARMITVVAAARRRRRCAVTKRI
jgi:hypothetical protein